MSGVLNESSIILILTIMERSSCGSLSRMMENDGEISTGFDLGCEQCRVRARQGDFTRVELAAAPYLRSKMIFPEQFLETTLLDSHED